MNRATTSAVSPGRIAASSTLDGSSQAPATPAVTTKATPPSTSGSESRRTPGSAATATLASSANAASWPAGASERGTSDSAIDSHRAVSRTPATNPSARTEAAVPAPGRPRGSHAVTAPTTAATATASAVSRASDSTGSSRDPTNQPTAMPTNAATRDTEGFVGSVRGAAGGRWIDSRAEGSPSTWRGGSSASSHRGSQNVRLAASTMIDGTSTHRTSEASMATAVARPTPNILAMVWSAMMNEAKTPTMMSAAAVMTWPVSASARRTATATSPERSQCSRNEVSRKTS